MASNVLSKDFLQKLFDLPENPFITQISVAFMLKKKLNFLIQAHENVLKMLKIT